MEPTIDEERPMMRPRRPLDPAGLPGSTHAEILRGFVASVRQWRGRSTTTLAFRRDDLVVLVGILGTDAETIKRRLVALTGCDRRTAQRFGRLLLASLAAIPIASAISAMPPPVDGDTIRASISEEPWEVGEPEDDRSTPATLLPERTAASATQPAAVPVAVPVATPVAAPETSPGRQGAEVTVSIARLGMVLPVVYGGQDVIDQGAVAHYWAPGWRPPAAAGAVGTYWLAAHRQTHGSPFRLLPEVVAGDRIDVATATATFTYEVTSIEVVNDDAGFGAVYGPDPAASVILLQTCVDDVRRLLVHGTLVARA